MATKEIPVFERTEQTQVGTTPDFQQSFQANAEANNTLSAIGASVAQNASNTMASQLGYESGKNPHGNLPPSLTEFDKNFAQSYQTQAQATLAQQGDKLLSDIHIEMAKHNRLTPEVIEQAHKQATEGLSKIAALAPTEVRSKLDQAFSSQLLAQTTQYKQKMISQQRQDQADNLKNAIDVGMQNITDLAAKGDFKGVDEQVRAVHAYADNAHANGFIDKEAARVAKETADQTKINGLNNLQATAAYHAGTFPEYAANFEKNHQNLTQTQFQAAGQSMMNQINFLQTMRSQDESLKSQLMLNQIATDPGSITDTQWTSFANSVSPLRAAQVQFHYIQALKANQKKQAEDNLLLQNWSNPTVWANTTKEQQTAAFNRMVDFAVDNSHKVQIPLRPHPITREEAEVQVAASAGGEVKVLTQELKNKLTSGNPAMIESATQQIHSFQAIGAGHALQGLSEQDHLMYNKYESLRNGMDPVQAARMANDQIYNQDPVMLQTNKDRWSNYVSLHTRGGVPVDKFIYRTFGLSESDFINPNMAHVYSTDILTKFQSNYIGSNGDENIAKKVTQEWIDSNFGETKINGKSFKTFNPIETALGYRSSDVVPFIHDDIINQLHPKLAMSKESYDAKNNDEYWEVLPRSQQTHGLFSTSYDPVQVKRTRRTAQGVKTDTYPLILQANSFNNWDIAINTANGMIPLFQFAPYLGVASYTPNSDLIKLEYSKVHHLKTG